MGRYELKDKKVDVMSHVKVKKVGFWYRVYICLCTSAGGVGFILIVPTVVVPVTKPAQRDAAVVLALKSVCGAGVLVCREERKH